MLLFSRLSLPISTPFLLCLCSGKGCLYLPFLILLLLFTPESSPISFLSHIQLPAKTSFVCLKLSMSKPDLLLRPCTYISWSGLHSVEGNTIFLGFRPQLWHHSWLLPFSHTLYPIHQDISYSASIIYPELDNFSIPHLLPPWSAPLPPNW